MSSVYERNCALFQEALGADILAALADPLTAEVMANPNGDLWIERHGHGMTVCGHLSLATTSAIIRLAAALDGRTITAAAPSVDVTLPGGQRFHASVPPRVKAPYFTIRTHQAQVLTRADYVPDLCPGPVFDRLVQAVVAGEMVLIAGMMSCHGAGTPVIMADGRRELIERIQVGDQVMGIDSMPRTVLETHQGFQPLYEIVPYQGDAFSVTPDHLLSLIRTPRTKGDPIHKVLVTVAEYMAWSKKQQSLYMLWRVGVEFPDAPLPITPYHLGVLLGDGSLVGGIAICKPDREVRQVACELAEQYGLVVHAYGTGSSVNLRIVSPKKLGRWAKHGLARNLQSLGLYNVRSGDKFIPDVYQRGSRQQRLELLAGLMDTDGHSTMNGGYDYISKSKQLAYDIVYVARSLGLRASVAPSIKGCPTASGYFTGTYWRVCLGGDCSVIPCRIPRKKAKLPTGKRRGWISGFTVKPLTVSGRFYGFTLEGDGLYLLGDFTVTHNSGKSTVMTTLVGSIPPEERVVTIGDVQEVQVSVPNQVALFAPPERQQDAIAEAWRSRADRVLVEEIRTGAAALAALDVWMGLKGGLCTVHGKSARDALHRLEHLCGEVSATGDFRPRIASVVDLVVYMALAEGRRQVWEVVEVQGWNTHGYELETLFERAGGSAEPGEPPGGLGVGNRDHSRNGTRR